jgi:hypothetical protein
MLEITSFCQNCLRKLQVSAKNVYDINSGFSAPAISPHIDNFQSKAARPVCAVPVIAKIWLKRTLGTPPRTDKSQYSGRWQAGGTLSATQNYRAVGVAAAAQRACGRCYSVFYFGSIYEDLLKNPEIK